MAVADVRRIRSTAVTGQKRARATVRFRHHDEQVPCLDKALNGKRKPDAFVRGP